MAVSPTSDVRTSCDVLGLPDVSQRPLLRLFMHLLPLGCQKQPLDKNLYNINLTDHFGQLIKRLPSHLGHVRSPILKLALRTLRMIPVWLLTVAPGSQEAACKREEKDQEMEQKTFCFRGHPTPFIIGL